MNYRLKAIASFEKDIKRLSKKYKSFKSDLLVLREQLLNNPKSGTPLGNSCYKLRLSISSKNKGKSGGARVITHLLLVNDDESIIYLLAIYDKAEQANVTDKQILELLKEIK
jgi:mRNA-degrading endonuclease RelE of RelBE toxin-antitoxin system